MSDKEPPEGRSTKRKKPVVIIGAFLAVLLFAAAGVWFSGVLKHVAGKGARASAGALVETPVLVDLPDIISNLDTGSHRASFIKLHAKLQVMHAADVAVLQAATPQILDIFQTYLRSTRPEELRGGEGTYRLREALMNRIDDTVSPVQVTDLLFTELLVQ